MRQLFRSLTLAVRRYFAKPVAFRVVRNEYGALTVTYRGVTNTVGLTWSAEKFGLRVLRKELVYIISNHPIDGSLAITELRHTPTEAYYTDITGYGLSFCRQGLEAYFPVLPKIIWIKEDGPSW